MRNCGKSTHFIFSTQIPDFRASFFFLFYFNIRFDTENYGFVKGEQFMKRLGVVNESSNENGHNDDPFNDDISIDDSASEFRNNIPYANLNGNL